MKRRRVAVYLALALACPAVLQAASIDQLKLADGRDEQNKIGVPLFDVSGVGPLRIGVLTGTYDRKPKIVRRIGRKFPPGVAGPEYELGAQVQLADLLTEALRSESPAMGFQITAGDDFGWDVKGSLKDIYLESRQLYMGATLFYGYLEVEFQVQKAGAEPRTARLRAHRYYGSFNAGMGRKDEAQEGLAHLLVEGAQEMLARLNRSHFQAPTHPDVQKRIGALTGKSRNDLHLVGLAGSQDAVPVLTALIPNTQDENDRAALIDAVGRLGSPQAVSLLATRYAKEDEDCRWATLKALDSIGGEEARAAVEKAAKDEHEPCRRLAARILGTAKP